MKCRIASFITIICILCICTACKDNVPVSTAGEIYSTDNENKEVTEITKTNEDYYKIIESNINGKVKDYVCEKINYDFISWICSTYNADFAKEFSDALTGNEYTDSFWHEKTGYSFHVLWDSYSGTAYTEDNNIYLREAADKEFTTMTFAGDLCLSEGWYTLNKYDEEGRDLAGCISADLIERLQKSDIFMLNNEFTFSNRGTPLDGKYYTFRANPDRVSILTGLGTDVVSLANNHVYDFGADSFYDTMSILKDNGIPYFGGGKDYNEACRPVFFIVNGMKIGFVGATRAEKIRYTPGASIDSPGVLLTYDNTEYLNVISEVKKNCDYLVAYVHWGTEDSHEVTDYQKTMGHQFIDAGADIVVGGHPHVLQGIEYYNGKPILYSLGDFWFNYETKETGAVEIQITPEGLKSMKFLPCMQDDFTTTLKTDSAESRRIYDFLQKLSFGITIDDDGYIR